MHVVLIGPPHVRLIRAFGLVVGEFVEFFIRQWPSCPMANVEDSYRAAGRSFVADVEVDPVGPISSSVKEKPNLVAKFFSLGSQRTTSGHFPKCRDRRHHSVEPLLSGL